MNNPKKIEIVKEQATYKIPTYLIDNNGVVDGEGLILYFCKGNKEDENVFRQEGAFVESIIQLAATHLESVNIGELSSRETSVAITKLQEALMWLGKRNEDRILRGVQNTYKK